MWWRRWSGGLGSWVLSGFTPRASQTSHVQLWPRELRAGSLTLAPAQLECCGNAVVVCVCVCYVCLCGEALANRRPTVIQCGRPFCDPTHRHPTSTATTPPLLPHPLAPFGRACPRAAPSAKSAQTMCARTGTSTHMASIKQGCMDPL